ncbi:MAG TPA: hypothetical protein VFQ36_14720 [Ktedonobacteraceae bacterium]|nr:hypothetical protein [Ktedonobacteraceae bacterium]
MNVNSGGPHILLFERDQQLTGLLISEFQLAGYECHTARTAVEVFDAIARFPVRLVLVNLAQAAANRREFWVALDAQRRGRGVQVFTFRCMNLAGYGPDDPEERSRAVLTDMEVDGMLGVMNLVDAVRARIPGSMTGTGSFSRLNTQATANGQASPPDARAAQMNMQSTATMPSMPATNPAGPSAPISPPDPVIAPRATMPAPTFTDKIRAVIYPGNRSYSPTPEVNWAPHAAPPPPPAPRPIPNPDVSLRPQVNPYANASETGGATLERPAGRDAGVPPTPSYQQNVAPTPSYQQNVPPTVNRAANVANEATGLEQLSRMVREKPPTWTASAPPSITPAMAQPAPAPTPAPAAPTPAKEREAPYKGPQTDQVNMHDVALENVSAPPTPVIQSSPVEPKPISDLDMRPSPIEGLPVERVSERRAAPPPPPQVDQTLAQGIASITSPLPAVHPPQTPVAKPRVSVPPTPVQVEVSEEVKKDDTDHTQAAIATEQEKAVDRLLVEQMPDLPAIIRGRSERPATSEEVLLDIVQSLPPMPALSAPPSFPSQQTPVLSGRATRSLGNVLLEGHLVPQHRLEVAQNIQRMLRGVDLNYQLGEILLMFKLLTPDQLLAASLVSYGLISAAQISGLGRVRQELHLMGLEYDLESLLVLFRILTPEQLREVRASWSS